MREYLITLLCIGSICGLAEMLAPSGKNGGLAKHLKLVCALSVLCVVAAPIGAFLGELKQGKVDIFGDLDLDVTEQEYKETFIGYLEEYNADTISLALKDRICVEFDIKKEDIDVRTQLITEDEKCTIENITVALGVGAISKDPYAIAEFVENVVGCDCVIIYN